VLDFYAPRIAAPDPLFVRVLHAAASELGHFYQRALAVDRLRDSEERFSSTMELAAIGISHVDHTGRFIYVNPQLCEMLDYAEKELLELTVKQVSHPGDVNVTDDFRDKLRSGAIKSFKMEKRYLRRGRLADLGGAHDRVQTRPLRQVRVRHLRRRGHFRAQARGGAGAVPRHSRRSHRVAESRDVRSALEPRDRDGEALRP
jgi:PAS domain S-box-containing protein